MPATSEGETGSVNAALADYLAANKDPILSDWRTRVRSDLSIGTGRSVNTAVLTHRLPHLLDGLIECLRRYRSGESTPSTSESHGAQGTAAWQQGYQLSEVLRELKHFRALLIYHVKLFEDLHPDHGMAAMLFVSSVSHGFLDDLVITITDEFLSAQLEVNAERWRRRIEKSGTPAPSDD